MTSKRKWTEKTIRALGTTTSIQTLADIIGCGKGKAYKMARQGEWERIGIRVIWISPRYRVVVQSILDVLGLSSDEHGSRTTTQPDQTAAPGENTPGGTAAEIPGPVMAGTWR